MLVKQLMETMTREFPSTGRNHKRDLRLGVERWTRCLTELRMCWVYPFLRIPSGSGCIIRMNRSPVIRAGS
ncbi:hypothetical protein Agabi119p4_2966 [Agaricus bisporus var. burnettii]|uniref:Uncharacterized protein n=1 Tax=Agaricus bisporus var. burnettii TaxID=192524 RepID=A0A8H7F692_AGABI|nr:hypothetical protein Agabi119p4_2966 [Agaricus bisporus var. burnettii]